MTARIALFLPAILLLSACESETQVPAPSTDDDKDRSAMGEVLGGTISDEMIAYEDIRSTAPTMQQDKDENADAAQEGESE